MSEPTKHWICGRCHREITQDEDVSVYDGITYHKLFDDCRTAYHRPVWQYNGRYWELPSTEEQAEEDDHQPCDHLGRHDSGGGF